MRRFYLPDELAQGIDRIASTLGIPPKDVVKVAVALGLRVLQGEDVRMIPIQTSTYTHPPTHESIPEKRKTGKQLRERRRNEDADFLDALCK